MKSSYLTNILLLCLVVGLYWFNNQESTNVNELQALTTLEQNDIQHIIISRPNSTNMTFEKTSLGWQITQPFQAQANTTRIKLLLSLLQTASYAQLDNSNTLQQFGLSPDSIELKLNKHSFQFGDIESISNHRYILHNNSVHLVEDKVMPMLQASATSFIENKLFAKDSIIEKLSLPLFNENETLSNKQLIIEKVNDHWQSKSAYTADQLTTLVDTWHHTYALQVLPITETNHSNLSMKIWLQNQVDAIEFDVQLTDKALYIIDIENKLKYQFSHSIAKQLFPSSTVAP